MTVSLDAGAATITVTVAGLQPSNWDVGSFGSGNIGLIGSDFTTSTQTGPNPTVTIDITGTAGNSSHTVLLSKAADSGTTWNSTYTLWIQPQSTGAGAGSFTWTPALVGTWTQIPTAPLTLTLGTVRRDRTGVTLQLQLQQLAVKAGTTASTPSFLTTLTYTYQ